MALRDQPYIPLYAQDFMTDEKLIECSASSTGVYIRIMCILHKQDEYGKLLLKQKYKQTDKQISNFATQLDKSLPYSLLEIELALNELLEERVLCIEGDYLCQKRMVRDNEISEIRAKIGSKGGRNTSKKFAKAKEIANTENENENNKGKNVMYMDAAKIFYKSEREKSKTDETYGEAYREFILYLFGENDLKEEAKHILKVPQQLSFEQFVKIVDQCEATGLKLKDLLNSMLNNPKYTKGKQSLNLTLQNWIRNNSKK